MFSGMKTGLKDHKGTDIRCKDRIIFYEFKKGYIETHSEDGWGRDFRLCRHDQYKVPDKEKTILGTVRYNPETASFVVIFDEYMLDSGRKKEELSILLAQSTEENIRKLEVRNR
jgi:hypothetical protein